ncbi:MAG: baeRF3 domain-containing protein [Syntrophales bacterium]
MKSLSKDELKTLMSKRKGPCISMFMPAYRAGAEIQQNQIRFRNLLREAEEKLIAAGCRAAEAKALLEPAQGLSGNIPFWRQQSGGLAVFISSDVFRHYGLPVNFDELIVVADRFHVKPLLPALSGDGHYYILTLSQKGSRLYEGTKQDIREIQIETIPKSLADALQYDELERQIRFHRGTQRGGERGSMMSGGGAELDNAKENISKYFRQIDKGLHDLLKGERVPLVLAGVDYLFPIYREVNTYPYLMEGGIPGNPKGINMEQLHKLALEIARPYFQRAENDAIAQYRQSSGTGLTSSDIKEIVRSACDGRVGLLFIATGHKQWGIFDQEAKNVRVYQKMEPGSEDLLDFSAIQTLLNGGTVFSLPQEKMPDDKPIAAVFRY